MPQKLNEKKVGFATLNFHNHTQIQRSKKVRKFALKTNPKTWHKSWPKAHKLLHSLQHIGELKLDVASQPQTFL